jgi:acetolactate synthase-1/2/3 large subunit
MTETRTPERPQHLGTRNGAQAMVEQLRREGVDVIFGLPGDQLMVALDALYDEPAIRYITTRHEQGTTYMADGYARVGGAPGTAMVVPGVGVYNAAAGLATAYACSSPVLLLAGQVNRHGIGRDLGLLHDVHDQLDVVRPITKWSERVTDADRIPGALREAFHQMRSGRPRPVEVEIPPETFADPTGAPAIDPTPIDVATPDPDALDRAVGLLLGAHHPLIVAGGGVVLGDATAELGDVADFLQAAVVTTREGKGAIDDRHPLSIGTMWVNRRLRPVLDEADVVLAVGTRLQGFGFGDATRIVHLDVDPAEIGRNAKVEVALAGHAKASLAMLHKALAGAGAPRASRGDERRAQRESSRDELRKIGPQAAIVDTLRSAIPEHAVVVPDTTTVGYMCHMYLPVYEPRTYVSTSYMGTLGFAFPTALGAKVAAPDRPVVALVGDGGFLFTATELATAVQHDIATVTVVFDDGAYGNSNRDQRERFGGRELGTLLRNPDWVKFAESFGASATAVKGLDQLEAAIRDAVTATGPVVIACPMDRLPSPF